jgi:uncharacterized membrane protein YphA (DoxX/SURF4 family)
MRIAVRIIQLLVGLLFIVSGLVKANDPLGLAYKMQEFFELWNSSLKAGHFFLRSPLVSLFDFLHDEALLLSIMMITLEIVAGVALLVGWTKRFILSLLLILIVFFTFLTGYAFLSGKFTNCGCFGDCIPITPFTSFIKDIVLLVLILMLLLGQKFIQPLASRATRTLVLVTSLVLTLGIQWYALNYLPPVDCLPFKKGNNIAEQTRPPKGSIPDSIAIRFIYEKGGKRFEFAPEELPADFDTYKYIDRVDKVVRKGNAEPKIKGFSLLAASGEDSSKVILEEPRAIIVFGLEPEKGKWADAFKKITEEAKAKNIPVYFASPAAGNWLPLLQGKGIENIQLLNTDFTVARTVARTNPTLLFLEKGTVKRKYSNHNFDEAVTDLGAGKF